MEIEIKDIDLFESENCTHTSLEIYNGEEAVPHKSLLQWCNSSAPSVTKYVTHSNKALIKFHSGEEYVAKGFQISFKKNCGYAVSTNGTGMITLHDSGESGLCTWIITSPDPLARIKFAVNHYSGNASSFQDVLTLSPAVPQPLSNVYYTLGSTLYVTLRVNGPTVFEASFSVFENCKEEMHLFLVF